MTPPFFRRFFDTPLPPPRETSATNSAPGRPMTRVEFESALTTWVRDGNHGDYIQAKEKILACYDAMQNNPTSLDAKVLALPAHSFTTLPECVGQLTALVQLNLHDCSALTQLPESLGQLTGMTNLSLNNCSALTTLPESLGQLTALKSLDLQNCRRLTHLPESFGQLTELVYLMLNSCSALTTLPESLGQLTALAHLSLNSCSALTTLPESLGQLTALTFLTLTNCSALTTLPESLGQLTALTYLNPNYCSALTTLPESLGQLTALAHLNLNSCSALTTLPESLGQLTALAHLNLGNCAALSSLPASTPQLSSNCHIYCGRCPMPLTVMDRVNQACAEQHALDPTRGPRFEYNMGAGAKITELPLDQQIQSWRNEQATQIQQSAGLPSSPAGGAVASGDLAAALSCIGPVEQGALSSLLARLRSTAHYRIAPENMIERVNTLIGQLLGDPSALQGATALAVEATETCDDRVALGLMMMEEALIERQAYGTEKFKPSLKEVATTGLGLFKSKHLQEIAHKKASSIVGFLDETEIVLKYITRLSKPLELPCPLDDMIFHGCATAVSEQDIAHAQQAVRAEVKREGALEQYLAGWGPWQAAIQRNAPELHQRIKQKIEQINENFYDCVDAGMQELATEQGKTPPDAQRVIELEAQQGKLMIERRQALLKPWLLATRELLEKESL